MMVLMASIKIICDRCKKPTQILFKFNDGTHRLCEKCRDEWHILYDKKWRNSAPHPKEWLKTFLLFIGETKIWSVS